MSKLLFFFRISTFSTLNKNTAYVIINITKPERRCTPYRIECPFGKKMTEKTILSMGRGKPIKLDDSIKNETTFDTNIETRSPVDVYLLPDEEITQTGHTQRMHVSKCMCAECNKITNADMEINAFKDEYMDVNTGLTHTIKKENLPEECPYCGKEFQGIANAPMSRDENNKTIWITPYMWMTRKINAELSDDSSVSKIKDITDFQRKIITENGIFQEHEYHILTNNLKKKENTETIIATDKNGNLTKNTTVQRENMFKNKMGLKMFAHAKHYSMSASKNLLKLKENGERCCYRTTDWAQKRALMKRCYSNGHMGSPEDPLITDIKARLVEKQFTAKYDIPISGNINRMYETLILSEENMKKQNMTEQDNTDNNKKNQCLYMMITYPAAFEYAIERAEKRIENFDFEQKRKKKENPDYQIKQVTQKGKALFLREEVDYVRNQLTTVDKNILDIIHQSKDKDQMKMQLEGLITGNVKLSDGKIKVSKRKTEPVQLTKILKTKMQDNIIGIANTIYTCHKMGIKDTNSINLMIDISEHSAKGNTGLLYLTKKKKDLIPLGTIPPIQTSSEMSFFRNLTKTHSPKIFVGADKDDKNCIYKDRKKFDLMVECINLYSDLKNSNIELKDNTDITVQEDEHEKYKRNIKSYLQAHSTTDAYINFCEMFGKETPKIINAYIKEIQFDDKIDAKKDEIKESVATYGFDATLEKYKDDTVPFEYAKKSIDAAVFDKENESKSKKQYVTTRNGKPLFKNRTLDEIHEELSIINRHIIDENINLENLYPNDIKKMQSSYYPDGKGGWTKKDENNNLIDSDGNQLLDDNNNPIKADDKYELSFHIHKDAYDIIESSKDLHNCLGFSHVENIKNKHSYVLYMENANKQRIAAIELRKDTYNGGYIVTQFQADHDNALDEQYAGAALKWLNDNKINYQNCHDVELFGSNESIYGDRNVDFHQQEIDKVTNSLVDVSQMKQINKRRLEKAKALFGTGPDSENLDFGVDEIPQYK